MDKVDSSQKIKDLVSITPLLLEKEKQIVSILLANDLVKLHGVLYGDTNDYTFNNIIPTTKGMDVFELHEEDYESIANSITFTSKTQGSISDEDVDTYRNIFPQGSRGPGKTIVKHRLERFLKEHNCSLENIMNAAEKYVQHNKLRGYNVMAAHYFLYKRDPQSRIDESKCEEFLELDQSSGDWREKTV